LGGGTEGFKPLLEDRNKRGPGSNPRKKKRSLVLSVRRKRGEIICVTLKGIVGGYLSFPLTGQGRGVDGEGGTVVAEKDAGFLPFLQSERSTPRKMVLCGKQERGEGGPKTKGLRL